MWRNGFAKSERTMRRSPGQATGQMVEPMVNPTTALTNPWIAKKRRQAPEKGPSTVRGTNSRSVVLVRVVPGDPNAGQNPLGIWFATVPRARGDGRVEEDLFESALHRGKWPRGVALEDSREQEASRRGRGR